jgi:glucokinase
MQAFVIDLGGSHFNSAVVCDGKILARSEEKIRSDNFQALLPVFEKNLQALAAQVGLPLSSFAGVVLGFPGIVNPRTTRITGTNQKFSDAVDLDVQAWSTRAFGLPLFLENDARLALLGEHEHGAAQGVDDCTLVTLGTGIGAAAMVDGKTLRGTHGDAGCLGGHIPVVLGGRPCTCGNVGCAEAEASTWALPSICADDPDFAGSPLAQGGDIDFERLFQTADGGDPTARRVLERCLQVWSALAVALIHAYGAQVVVFGGGVMARADAILPGIRRHADRHSWTPNFRARIEAAALGREAALYGALPLIRGAGL